ncbi:MAG: hypothetical protein JW727_03725 [Candidatus Aenigmarchaeota archaeon]|nr:hypothetical protein [Candidatus Aenigmarchaeota archaeon]
MGQIRVYDMAPKDMRDALGSSSIGVALAMTLIDDSKKLILTPAHLLAADAFCRSGLKSDGLEESGPQYIARRSPWGVSPNVVAAAYEYSKCKL